MEEEEEEQIEGFSDRTSGTFLSGLSDCSNLTFRKVQRYWESNSAAHKEARPCDISHLFTQQTKYDVVGFTGSKSRVPWPICFSQHMVLCCDKMNTAEKNSLI